MDLIKSVKQVADGDYLLFDCRADLMDKQQGRRAFDAGHLPGARFADLEKQLAAAPGQGGRHPLPDKQSLVQQFRAWGINNHSHLVCYDQNTGAFAARFWWLARWLGHENVYVLDGGLEAWIAAGEPLTTELTHDEKISPGQFEAATPLTREVAADQVLSDHHLLIDARDAARYRGETEPVDPIAGHIPGAVSAPFIENLQAGRFLPATTLRQRFEGLGANNETDIVCYCGSGVTAAHNILALKLAGFDEPALYAGSWSGWITDPSRPIETG